MPDLSAGYGPGFYIIEIVYVCAALFALAMIFDAMRPLRPKRLAQIIELTGKKREPLAFYQIVGGIYVLIVVAAQFSFTPAGVKLAAMALLPIMAVIEVAYLLRVVFPKVPQGYCIDWSSQKKSNPCDVEEK